VIPIVPTPMNGESCEDFCIRAHRSSMAAIPNASQRNQAVWNAWDMANPGTERYQAQQKFAGYRHLPSVCHFTEHTINTRSGPFVVGPNELSAICKNLNRRSREVGLYPALIDKHTSNDPSAGEPQIVGYSGCFRIGMIGDQQQKYSIFGDEFHKPRYIGVVDQKPRRSVELMRYADSSRNFFDPIACLGAEAPRLDLPPAYYGAIEDDGVMIERYSIMAPSLALPGGGNTYIRGTEDHQKYQAQPAGSSMPITPEEMNQLVNAISNAIEPRLAALEGFMKSGQQQMGGIPGQQIPGQPPAGLPQDPGAIGQPSPSVAPATGISDSQPGNPGDPLNLPSGGQPPGQKDPYALPALAAPLMAGAVGGALMRNSISGDEEVVAEKYSQEFVEDLIGKHQELLEETGKLRSAVGNLMQERTDAQRAFRLQQMSQKYSAIEANLDEELSRVLYSAGSEMTDDEFDAHCQTIERYAAQSSPPKGMIPDGELPSKDATKERYSQAFNDEVVKRCTAAMHSGKVRSYDEVADELARERGIVA
jgi:hypothetical protein